MFSKSRVPFLTIDTKDTKLRRIKTAPGTPVHATTRQDIQQCNLLCQAHRIIKGCKRDTRSDTQIACVGCKVHGHQVNGGTDTVGTEMMFSDPYAVVGTIIHDAHSIQCSTIDIGDNLAPHGIKWIGDTDQVIATTEASQTIVRVDVNSGKVVASIGTDAQGSHIVALSPDNATAYVANIQGGSVSVVDLDTNTLKQVVPMGQGTEGISVSPDGKHLWVGNNGSRNVLKVDAESFEILQTIPTEGIPIRVEISPNGKWVAVSEADLHRVSVFSADTGAVIGQTDLTLSGGQVPVTILWAPDSESYFVAATASNTVHEVETIDWTVGKVFKAGDGSDGLALVMR